MAPVVIVTASYLLFFFSQNGALSDRKTLANSIKNINKLYDFDCFSSIHQLFVCVCANL